MRSDASTQRGYDQTVVAATLDWLLARVRSYRHTPSLFGLSGLQGSGKSTFARQLASVASARGVCTAVLALDDFYLGRRERMRLARDVHPLLVTRGVPGTHDLDLLQRTLRELKHANAARPVSIPRFDKGRDTRWPPSRWRKFAIPPRVVLLEGWCVGVPAQGANALARAVNPLERDEDSDGRWRR